MRFAILVITLIAVDPASVQAKSSGGYTSAQASRGATVYTQYCTQCHGANLQGESGPALSGQVLRAAYGGGTAAQLYDFISRQMPQNNPASLSQAQYLDVTSYVLSRNGFPSGNTPLTTASLSQVRMSAQRMSTTAAGPNTDEIVRAPPPVRNVYSKIPAGAKVNVTDPMMLNAASDENNWLLH